MCARVHACTQIYKHTHIRSLLSLAGMCQDALIFQTLIYMQYFRSVATGVSHLSIYWHRWGRRRRWTHHELGIYFMMGPFPCTLFFNSHHIVKQACGDAVLNVPRGSQGAAGLFWCRWAGSPTLSLLRLAVRCLTLSLCQAGSLLSLSECLILVFHLKPAIRTALMVDHIDGLLFEDRDFLPSFAELLLGFQILKHPCYLCCQHLLVHQHYWSDVTTDG